MTLPTVVLESLASLKATLENVDAETTAAHAAQVAALQARIDELEGEGPVEPTPDTSAPVVTILPVTEPIRTGTVVLRATVTDNVGVTSVFATVNGQDAGALTNSNGQWVKSLTIPTAGTYSIIVSAGDAAGNIGIATRTLVVTDPPVEPPVEPPVTGDVYGPTGKHKFSLPGFAQTHEVAATWSAISAQISTCQSHSGACRINLAPGTLGTGNGIGSSASGVIQNVGSASKVIYVTPRDGYGTVKTSAGTGVAFVGVKGVILDYIDFSQTDGVMVRNTDGFKIGHTVVKQFLSTANSAGVKNLELVEVAFGIEQVNGVSYDRAQFKIADSAGFTGLKFIGCYGAPNYKPNGSSGHCDTVQFVRTSSSGSFVGTEIIDTALFQSADQGLITANTSGGKIAHSAFFGGATSQLRYPMYPGGDPITLANALWADWSGVAVSDTIVAGSISSAFRPTSVTNSKSTAGANGWSALGTLTKADLDRIAPSPLPAAIWK